MGTMGVAEWDNRTPIKDNLVTGIVWVSRIIPLNGRYLCDN